jgi:hypothetical protein
MCRLYPRVSPGTEYTGNLPHDGAGSDPWPVGRLSWRGVRKRPVQRQDPQLPSEALQSVQNACSKSTSHEPPKAVLRYSAPSKDLLRLQQPHWGTDGRRSAGPLARFRRMRGEARGAAEKVRVSDRIPSFSKTVAAAPDTWIGLTTSRSPEGRHDLGKTGGAARCPPSRKRICKRNGAGALRRHAMPWDGWDGRSGTDLAI